LREEKDPVCGCKVSEAGFVSEYEGKTYHFCSEACKRKFEMSPGQWVRDQERAEKMVERV